MKAYVNGQLALARMDSRVPAGTWLDAVYAIITTAPHELLEKLHGQITIKSARLRPDRDSWGMLPDQVAMQEKLTQTKNGKPARVRRGGLGQSRE